MGNTVLTTSLLVGLFLFQTFVGSHGDAQLVQQTCSKTSDPAFCSAALLSDPESLTADIAGLDAISIKLAGKNATATLSTIGDLLKNPSLDNYTKSCLMDCQGLYSDSVDGLNQALDKLNSKAYQDVNVQLSAAQTNADTCESQFGERPGYVSPLTKENQYLTKLGSVGLAILGLISKQ